MSLLKFLLALLTILIFISNSIYSKEKITLKDSTSNDTTQISKFDKYNKKAEALFKIIPVPIISYSQEAGNVFGLAKFNSFRLNPKDTLSGYSKISEVFTLSTNGNVNASVATSLSFKEDKYMIMGFINYQSAPEYILGVGNDVSIDDIETISTTRLKFVNYFLYNIYSDLYLGLGVDLTNTFKVIKDSNSFLEQENYTGKDGGVTTGLGLSAAWDSRDNRFNASSGEYIFLSIMPYADVSGSGFNFTKFKLELRKFYNPWHKHVIALQAATNYCWGNVPYYELSQLGGEERMRGYYKGALRDKALLDAQLEYRMPLWKIFGITGWVGTGRVAENYKNMALNGLWLNYGLGMRIKVDSESDINLRMDIGFGNDGIQGFYLNFSEAF